MSPAKLLSDAVLYADARKLAIFLIQRAFEPVKIIGGQYCHKFINLSVSMTQHLTNSQCKIYNNTQIAFRTYVPM